MDVETNELKEDPIFDENDEKLLNNGKILNFFNYFFLEMNIQEINNDKKETKYMGKYAIEKMDMDLEMEENKNFEVFNSFNN